ncbi:MAG TPA: methylated-DNA--[protein]-cysteine S-methyltransferase [Longimicrobiales bacterium]
MRYFSEISTPIGPITIVSDGRALTHVSLRPAHEVVRATDWIEDDARLAEARSQLAAYFAGELRAFALPLSPRGSAFQRNVWTALSRIPFGETTSYGAVADSLGLPPGSARAVGAANRTNPIAIIVPCHRVIGADGSLTGYGGGLERKQFLLEHEAAVRGVARQMELGITG